jgi:hypothetical protein
MPGSTRSSPSTEIDSLIRFAALPKLSRVAIQARICRGRARRTARRPARTS